ncbi:MAG: ABC transporter ATP-binding protein [Xanthobacteraceae bacterium]|jgi:putrescine transport system ATP-binding protein
MADRAGAAGADQAQGRARRINAPDPAGEPLVRFDGIVKRFGDSTALDRLTLDIYPGEFFALLGPSGCRKSTLLRLLAGFETPSEGRVLLAGDDIGHVPPYRRPVNMMFQSYALFPHLTVAENVAFGLRQEGLPRRDVAARVAEMLALVRLEEFARRKPDRLSGGERQRVALARSLAKRPKVLLLDEPLAALDKKLRQRTQYELMELQERLGTTFVIVTHDQEEAMTVADRIAVMSRGRLVQVGVPSEVYEQPNSRYVAEFVGDVNLLEGRLASSGPGGSVIESRAGRLASTQQVDAVPGATVWMALRPEKLRLAAGPPGVVGENCARGTVLDIGYLGSLSVYQVALDNGTVMRAAVANATRLIEQPIGRDDCVWLSWTSQAGVVLTR